MNKFGLIGWGFGIGFLSACIWWRVQLGMPIWLSVCWLIVMVIILAARLTR